MPRSKKPCSDCGRMLQVGKSSLENPTCHPCRRARPRVKVNPAKPCEGCGVEFHPGRTNPGRRYCSIKCFHTWYSQDATARRRSVSLAGLPKARRRDRERVTPGIRPKERDALRALWKRQGRSCYYCERPGNTIDHLIPLARGGTNYEGNLVPCCKQCNSSKADLLLIEWRLGRPHGMTVDRRPWLLDETITQRKTRKVVEAKPRRAATCCICGETFTPANVKNVTCGPGCSDERARRQAREAYRAKVGLPPTWHIPVKHHAA